MDFGYRHYVPALKWRKGEYRALSELDTNKKASLTPLIEMPPVPWDYETESPAKTIDQHLSQTINQIGANWGSLPAFLDVEDVQSEVLANGEHPLTYLTEGAVAANLNLIPTTGLDRDQAYQSAIAGLIQSGISEIAIRLRTPAVFSPQLDHDLGALLSQLGLAISQVHIILDFQAVDENAATVISAALPLAVASSTLLQQSATLTFLATGFPPNLSEINPGVGSITRIEWDVWQMLLTQSQRKLSFGDYAISHFESAELDPRVMRVSASIRYTSSSEWIIFRGYWLQHPAHGGYGQFHDLCTQIIQHPAYSTNAFSAGDQCIWDCAHHNSGTGNLTTWRQAGTNHHLTFVINQIANLP